MTTWDKHYNGRTSDLILGAAAYTEPRGLHVGVNMTTGERRGTPPPVDEPEIDDEDTVRIEPDDLPHVTAVLMATGEVVETPRIVPKLEALIPPQTAEEYELLRLSIAAEGVRDAAVVWTEQNVLVDGHHRYRACAELDKPLPVRFVSFDCLEAVIVWMLEKQLGQRNLTDPARIELALELEPAYAALAKARQAVAAAATNAKLGRGEASETLVPNSAQASDQIGDQTKQPSTSKRTRDAVAKVAGVGHDKLNKGKAILNIAPAWLADAWRKSIFSTHGAYTLMKAVLNAPKAVQSLLERHAANGELSDWLTAPLIDLLVKGCKQKADWFDDLALSGCIQLGDAHEAVALEAGLTKLREAIDRKAQLHRQEAAKGKLSEREHAAQAASVEADVDALARDQFVVTGDLRLLYDLVPDNSVDLFYTDPPYEGDTIHLYGELARLAAAKLKPGGFVLAYCGHAHLPTAFTYMGEHLSYWWTFSIQHSGADARIWARQLFNQWKPVAVYVKPFLDGALPPAPDWMMDGIEGGGKDKRYHKWGQDAGEATYWLEKLTHPNDLVIDPFTGGGSIPVACKLTHRRWLGTELNAKQAQIARERLEGVTL